MNWANAPNNGVHVAPEKGLFILAGANPVVPIALFRHVAIPQFVLGNHTGFAWCKRPGCPEEFRAFAVGATWGSRKWGSLNTTGIMAAPQSVRHGVVF